MTTPYSGQMASKVVHYLWLSYKKKVVPEDAPEIQIQETELAFYAGAYSLFSTLPFMFDAGEDATDKDMIIMNEIQKELETFLQSKLEPA
jgi:hypothetical protein